MTHRTNYATEIEGSRHSCVKEIGEETRGEKPAARAAVSGGNRSR